MKEAIKFSYDSKQSATRVDVSFLIKDDEDEIVLPAGFIDAPGFDEDGGRTYPLHSHNIEVLTSLLNEIQLRKERQRSGSS